MENLGTFEALAAAALLLRETLHVGNALRAHYCAASVWQLLLLIGSSTPCFEVLPAMAELADKALLNQVVHRGEQVASTSVTIRRYENLLRSYGSANGALLLHQNGATRRHRLAWHRNVTVSSVGDA